MDSFENEYLKLSLAEWLEANADDFIDQDDAYEALNEIFQPILDDSVIPI